MNTSWKNIEPASVYSPQKKVRKGLLTFAYKQLPMSQMASFFCATLIYLGLHNVLPNAKTLQFWYFSIFLIALCRITSGITYQKLLYNHTKPKFSFWKKIYFWGAVLGGAAWGIVGGFFFPEVDHIHQIFIIFILAGVTAGGIPSLAAELKASIFFMITSLSPLVFRLFYNDLQDIFILFGSGLVAYCISLILFSMNTHNIIKKSIRIQCENEQLVETLSRSKIQLENINTKLKDAATHDPLTGIANRLLLEAYLKTAIEQAKHNQANVVLMYLDIDNFKQINDVYGHHAGDKLLMASISRIKKVIRKTDLVARLGGDEIIIALADITELDIIKRLANQLCQITNRPIKINDQTINTTISIGISIYPIDGSDMDILLSKADKAMYYIKKHGKNGYRFSTPATELETTMQTQ